MRKTETFLAPTKPYSLVDALNRAALATGSMRAAGAGHSADYNGHHNIVEYNTFRRYWVVRYTWAGSHVVYRGHDFATAVEAGLRAYDGQGRGASLRVNVPEGDAESLAVARSHPRLVSEAESKAAEAEWRTDLHGLVHTALDWERKCGVPTSLLLESRDGLDWNRRLDAYLAARRARAAS